MFFVISYNVSGYAMFAVAERRQIWVKEIVQPLKIIYAQFLEPHIQCYVMW